ncbi:hypothetical protein [Amycolatopsis acidiphila]|nr:hypothetical protein [Amycolatopsis acidiphila]
MSSIDLDANQIHDLFSTFSDWTADEVDAARQRPFVSWAGL